MALTIAGLSACTPATLEQSGGSEGKSRKLCLDVELDSGEQLAGQITVWARNDTTGEGSWFPEPETTIGTGFTCFTTSFAVGDMDSVRYNGRFHVTGDPEWHYLVGYEYAEPSSDINGHAVQMDGLVEYPYTVWNDPGDGFDAQFVYTEGN
ncbi:MAG: hypothetical protein WC802_05460 [Patescibacteria group bacterium]